MVVPTAAEIRQARAGSTQAWLRRVQVIEGPCLAWLGVADMAVEVLARPAAPFLPRARPRAGDARGEAAAPGPHAEPATNVAVLNPWLGTRLSDPAIADRPPPPLRGGAYGDLAWRGWHLVHRLRTRQSVVAALARARGMVNSANRVIERCADELHDGSEEVMGQLIVGAHHLRRRITAAILATAYTLRSLRAVTDARD